jgi:Tfp pilus assembly protein PilF
MRIVTRRNMEAALEVIDARLASESESLDLRADRARLLAELGQIEEAKRQYLEILKRDPRHLTTLISFSLLLYQAGFTSAARTASQAAIAFHPENARSHTNLADLLVYDKKFDAARSHYEIALQIDPGYLDAHRGLAMVFWELGDEERAQHHQSVQFHNRPVETLPYLGTGDPVPLLVFMSARGGNLPWRDLIDNRVFLIIAIATEFYDQSKPLPWHQLIFNTIGDADICQPALEAAKSLLAHTTAPVINSPAAVLATGRMSNAQRLDHLPGVVTPRIVQVARTLLIGPEGPVAINRHGLAFPVLLRRPGFHTGQHFVLVDSSDALAAAAACLPGDDVLMIQYLDARGNDGLARKYRVMTIGGQLYPLHLAIAEQWKVHYFSAAMSGNAEHQAEEAAFLSQMPRVLGPKAMRALELIRDALGLDYGGIDFGLGRNGEVLLFEANATMLIRPPDAGAQWDYRRGPIREALDAARTMLYERAGVGAEAHA